MNKEIICDKCKKDLTKLPSGEIYYKITERRTIAKKKMYNKYKIALSLKNTYLKTKYRYCKECYSNIDKQPVGVV